MKMRFAVHSCALLATAAACAGTANAKDAAAAASCRALSAPTAATVVELYTSEGCSSCPPADRWLSAASRSDEVIALAFHVDYWDRLGWKDRFASPVFTQRQLDQRPVNGARFAYTPQVVVDGRDRPGWHRMNDLHRRGSASPVSIELSRVDGALRATVRTTDAGAPPARLSGYWAVTESGHRSVVKAGENDGATLHHDHVVRELRPLPAWLADSARPASFTLPRPANPEPGVTRRFVFVVTDAGTGRPVQAVSLAC